MTKLQNYKNLTGDRLVNARPWDGREEKRAECGYIKNDIQWIPKVVEMFYILTAVVVIRTNTCD